MQEHYFQADIDRIGDISVVPTILDVVCRATGMGFAAVARVTESRWVACQVLDNIHFGLGVGGELPVETTLCHVVRQHNRVVVFDDALAEPEYANHITPTTYGLRSYISVPINLSDGRFFGTLCAIDPQPAKVNNPQIIQTFTLFAQLIAHHIVVGEQIDAARQMRQRSIRAEEAGGIGTFELDIASGQMLVSAEYCRLFGLPQAPSYPASISEKLVVREDAELMSNDQSRRTGSAKLDVEYRIRRADTGEIRWLARSASFANGPGGKPATMFGAIYDVTDRHRLQTQQERLLQLGDQFRDAASHKEVTELAGRALGEVLGVHRAGYGRVDWRAKTFTVDADWSSDGLPSVSGQHPISSFAKTAERLASGETVAIENVPGATWLGNDLDQYAENGTVAMIDIPLIDHGQLVGIAFAHQGKPRVWEQDEIDFAHGVADRTHAALAKLDAEAGQELLNQELGHRMKNQLALVQAIVGQTLRSADNVKAAGDILQSRIQVLANAHDILLTGVAGRTTVAEIVRKAVLLHDDRLESRFLIDGPAVIVASRPALSLSLIMHELSTNAAKYGALSNTDGVVNIVWRIERNEGASTFVFDWTEVGGPTVQEPSRKGSGSRLIRAGLSGVAGSSVVVEYEPSGLRCHIVAELSSFQTER